MQKNTQSILDYYNSLESKLGYTYLTWKTKHFGYYPHGKSDISEKKAQELMMDLIAQNVQIKPSYTLLDAGCGYATTACYLAKKYKAKITGIDINPFEIKKAKKYANQLNVGSKTSFQVMDYTKTSFSKSTFDAIYTMETLSHATDLLKTLKEFLRILKPGGKIALFEYTLAPDQQFSQRDKTMLDLGVKGTAAFGLKEFRHDQFPNILKRAGFIKVREQNITRNFLPSLQRLTKMARIPYIFIQLFRLQKYFVNATVAVEWETLVKKDLIRYCIFTTEKPKN